MKTKRVFLIGCPRSGTTLLQSMIATHEQVVSFPETRFFSRTLPINPLLRKLKIHGQQSRSIINTYLKNNGFKSLYLIQNFLGDKVFTYNEWCEIIIDTLDSMIEKKASSEKEKKPIWGLEKSPRHLYYISSIENKASNNKYIHLLRNGPEVVASMYLVTNRYPKQWEGRRSIRKCIKWWNDSIRESLKYTNEPNHIFISYEQLLENPERVLKSISYFLDLKYSPQMVQNYPTTAGSLKKNGDKWHNRNESRSLTQSKKLEKNFNLSTIRYIKRKTLNINLRQFFH